jgi:glycosyl hydrolase family 99
VTTTSQPGWQPSFPIRAAFYYPWFPQGWSQQGMNPFTHYHPLLGRYDVRSPSVLAAHIRAMRYAGLQAGIASWWGPGSLTDNNLGPLLKAAAGQPFRWSVYDEAEGQGDPTVGQLTADLTYLRDHYGTNPSFLRIGGRFVVFVYAQPHDGCAMADRWKRANTVGAYVVLKVFDGYRGCASHPDGWHQYGPLEAVSDQAPFSYTVSPGFWKANEPTAGLARSIDRWRQSLRAMVASKARFQLVTTFNEWGEGTSVEAATEWASPSGMGTYLDALHDILGG